MSESTSRVLSFIQRAKQLTDSTKNSSIPQICSNSNISTTNHPQTSRLVASPAGLQIFNFTTSATKTEPISQARIPSPANGKSHKSSISEIFVPNFQLNEEKFQYSRKGTPISSSPIPPTSKPAHKSSTSQVFFPKSPSNTSNRAPIPKPLLSSKSSSQSKISPLCKLPKQSAQPLKSTQPNLSTSSKPPTPNHSSYSRSSTPKSSASPLPSSLLPAYSRIPANSELITQPAQDPVDLDSAIDNLLKIRNEIDAKIKEQQMIELQMIQIIAKKLEKVKKSESKYENIEKAKLNYKEKFKNFVEKTNIKLSREESSLTEVENENIEMKGKLKDMKSFANCVWFGRQVQEFDVKVKSEDDLDEILDEQICFLVDNSKSENFHQLNIALCKKWLVEHSKLTKAELQASIIRREEEALIEVLENKLQKAEKFDVI